MVVGVVVRSHHRWSGLYARECGSARRKERGPVGLAVVRFFVNQGRIDAARFPCGMFTYYHGTGYPDGVLGRAISHPPRRPPSMLD